MTPAEKARYREAKLSDDLPVEQMKAARMLVFEAAARCPSAKAMTNDQLVLAGRYADAVLQLESARADLVAAGGKEAMIDVLYDGLTPAERKELYENSKTGVRRSEPLIASLRAITTKAGISDKAVGSAIFGALARIQIAAFEAAWG